MQAHPVIWNSAQFSGSGSSFSFTTIQTDFGTSPVADSASDTVTFTSSDSAFEITGDSSSDQIDFTLGTGIASYLTGASVFMFSGTNSDISGYESAPTINSFIAGATQSIAQTVTTTPTLLEEFATASGVPNVTAIPPGLIGIHYETQKTSGGQSYYTYAEVYKRTTGGTETLIATSDNSSSTSVNTLVQTTVTAFLSSITTLNATDRLVVKIYAVISSSSATITLYWDNNTNARLQVPTYSTGINTGDVTLAAIGSSPNANAASLSGQILNLQPASASFGGVVTTTTQSFAGDKTFTGVVAHSLGTASLPAIVPTGDVDTGIWSSGANSLSISTVATERIRIGVSNSGFININGNFTATNAGFTINAIASNVVTACLRLANGQSVNQLELYTYLGSSYAAITKEGYINFPLGAVGNPTYSFFGDTNTGAYSAGADTYNIATNGVERIRFMSTGYINIGGNFTDIDGTLKITNLTTTTPALKIRDVASLNTDKFVFADSSNTTVAVFSKNNEWQVGYGSLSNPAYSFYNDADTGMMRYAADSLRLVVGGAMGFEIDSNKNLVCAMHNNATAFGNSSTNEIRSDSDEVPTFTAIKDVSGISVEKIKLTRVGNHVIVSGYGSIESVSGAANCSFYMSLPIASDFQATYDAGGAGTVIQSGDSVPIAIYADAANDIINFDFYSDSVSGAANFSFILQYEVI